MTKEQVIKKCREAIDVNKSVRETTNNALSHAIGLLEKQDGEYERGLKDAWELAKKIVLPVYNDGYTPIDLKEIFDSSSHNTIMYSLTPQEALAKVKEYEKKKEEEAAKPKLGDVVEVYIPQIDMRFRIVYICGGPTGLNGFDECKNLVTFDWTQYYDHTVTKTGEHIDISGLLDGFHK